MKRLRFFPILIVCIVLLCSCGLQNAASSAAPLPSDDGATEITIEVLNRTNFYNEAAEKFEAKTGVKVNVINDYNEDAEEMVDIAAKANTEMMAGKGADLYAYDLLNFRALGDKQLVCNLKSWVSQDSFFSQDNFFMNILNASLSDNSFAIPQGFTITKLMSTIPVPQMEGLGSVTWEQFFDKAKDFNRSGRLLKIYDAFIFEQRFNEKAEYFIDVNKKSQQLNSTQMVDLLQQCKKWADQDLCIPMTSQDGYNEYSLFEVNNVLKSCIYSLNNISDGVYYVYDMPSDSNQNCLDHNTQAANYVVINAASRNQKTAWDFIKFLLEYDMQISRESFYLPLNRAAYNMQMDFGLNILQREGFIDNVAKERNEILDKIESIQNIQKYDQYTSIVSNEAYRYFIGDISADQAAKEMASKVQLYLLEQ